MKSTPLFRESQFRLLFLGRTVSFLGNAVAPVALAFAVLDLTGSKSDLGLLLAARSLPQVFFVLVGGALSDRLPRHHVMVASSIVSGLSQAAIALLLLSHHAQLWHLIVLSVVNGSASAFFFPASSGVIPQTVSRELLQQANALLRLVQNGTLIVGAAVGGIAVAAVGPGWAIAFDGVTFLSGAIFIGAMSVQAAQREEVTTFIGELREGWREFRGRTWLWAIVLQFSFVNAASSGGQNVLGPVVAKEKLGGAAAWGAILAAESVGLVLGGVVALRFRPRRMLLVATFGILLLPIVLIALAVPAPVPVIMATAFVAGIGIETFGVLWDTTMQQEIPQAKLSRVYAYDMFGSIMFVPIGLAVAGPLAQAIGVRNTLWAAFAGIEVVTLAVLAVPEVRNLTRR
ncbi:MAG: MFS transporter [Thermoleophilia bacterium]